MKRALILLMLLSVGVALAPAAGASHRDSARERFERRFGGSGTSSFGSDAFDFSDPRFGRFRDLADFQDMPGFDEAAARGGDLNPLDGTSPAAADPLAAREPATRARTDAPERVEADPVVRTDATEDVRATGGARGSALPRTGSPVAGLALLGIALLNGGLFLREFTRGGRGAPAAAS